MLFNPFIESLAYELNNELPGMHYQLEMFPSGLVPDSLSDSFITAAVLILLYEKLGLIKTVLIKRPKYEGVHSDQMAFPGGKVHKGDRDIFHTALRETNEELGIKQEDIEVIGSLSDLYIAASNINVTPIIGYTTKKFTIVPELREVEYYKEINILDIVANESIIKQVMPIKIYTGQELLVPYYSIEKEKVWGATAMIMSELLELIRRSLT